MSHLTSFFQVTRWLIPLNGGHLYKPSKKVTTYGSKRVTPLNAGLFAGGHLCALGMGTLEQNTTSPGVCTFQNKHHTQKTFRFSESVSYFIVGKKEICRYRLFSVGVCWNFFEGNTWRTSDSGNTDEAFMCGKNKRLIYCSLWRMHVEPTYLTWPW